MRADKDVPAAGAQTVAKTPQAGFCQAVQNTIHRCACWRYITPNTAWEYHGLRHGKAELLTGRVCFHSCCGRRLLLALYCCVIVMMVTEHSCQSDVGFFMCLNETVQEWSVQIVHSTTLIPAPKHEDNRPRFTQAVECLIVEFTTGRSTHPMDN